MSKTQIEGKTAVLVLSDGTVYYGYGLGAIGKAVGEVCFNTSMTGYQEILTDPSYAGQIVTFTFPHVGNVGANQEDIETGKPAARGLVLRDPVTGPSNWRATETFDDWLKDNYLIGISGVDTRALTIRIRDGGAPTGVVCHAPDGQFDIEALKLLAREWPGLEGMDLAKEVTCGKSYEWGEGVWHGGQPSAALTPNLAAKPLPNLAVKPVNAQDPVTKAGKTEKADKAAGSAMDVAGHDGAVEESGLLHVVAMDFGAKQNILRCLVSAGCRVTVVPATATAQEILSLKPDGVFLSNGPGDPAATGVYAVPVVQTIMRQNVPLFGICLGHQLLALALGGRTEKMRLGHRGGNHPVKDLKTGKVEITSQNHGFMVLPESLPANVEVTHISLFDQSNEGLRLTDKPVFSVQYHPEASPGPHDSHYLFERFVEMMRVHKAQRKAA